MEKKTLNSNVVIGIVLLIIEALFYWLSTSFINPDAARWPQGILLVSAILSILLVLNGLKGKDVISAEFKTLRGPILTLAMIIIYSVAMDLAGFFIATIIFCPLGMYLLGQKNWKVLIGVPLGLDAFVYVLFVMQLQLQMP